MTMPRPDTIQNPEPDLRVVLADNPSPMTHWGTNSFIIGTGQVAVIDPGPDDPRHLANILAALKPGEEISHILVTHSHLDHSPLAARLSKATGAPVYAYGDSTTGRSDTMIRLARQGLIGGGEGVDHGFKPDHTLKHGQSIDAANWQLTAIWTPGHMGNHLCFSWGEVVFTGDHIMGWASSLVSPPDGDLTDFMASTRSLADVGANRFYPAHGAPIFDPRARIDWLINHRLAREASILAALAGGASDAFSLTKNIYQDTPKPLMKAAERNVFAHLLDLHQSTKIAPLTDLTFDTKFTLT